MMDRVDALTGNFDGEQMRLVDGLCPGGKGEKRHPVVAVTSHKKIAAGEVRCPDMGKG